MTSKILSASALVSNWVLDGDAGQKPCAVYTRVDTRNSKDLEKLIAEIRDGLNPDRDDLNISIDDAMTYLQRGAEDGFGEDDDDDRNVLGRAVDWCFPVFFDSKACELFVYADCTVEDAREGGDY
jgi:hypothetical protein